MTVMTTMWSSWMMWRRILWLISTYENKWNTKYDLWLWWWLWWWRWWRLRLRLRSFSSTFISSLSDSLSDEINSFKLGLSFKPLFKKLKHWNAIWPAFPQRLHTVRPFCPSISSFVFARVNSFIYSFFFCSYAFASSLLQRLLPEIASHQLQVCSKAKSTET